MEKTALLNLQSRDELGSRANNRLRKQGYLPGVISAKGKESISIKIKADDLQKAVSKYGTSQVFKLKLDKKKSLNAMIKEIQIQPLTFNNLSVVFQNISLTEETKANVEISIEGRELLESNRFTLTQQMDSLAVKGLPNDIPNYIVVNVSELQPGDVVAVKDVKLPNNVTADVDLELILLSIAKPRVAEEATEEVETEIEAVQAVE